MQTDKFSRRWTRPMLSVWLLVSCVRTSTDVRATNDDSTPPLEGADSGSSSVSSATLEASVNLEASSNAAEQETTSPVEICDGSEKLRLRFFVVPSQVTMGGAVFIEHGNWSFAVDGKCRYWINGGFGGKPYAYGQPWRTGVLPADLLEQLRAALDLQRLEDLGNCRTSGTTWDVSWLTIRSEYSRVLCQGSEAISGSQFEPVWELLQGRGAELYLSGDDITGGVRVVAYEASFDTFSNFQDWSLTSPVSSYLVPVNLGDSPGNSLLVADPEDAERLRELRRKDLTYRASHPEYQRDGVYVADGEQYAVVYLRDALPYEDERGLWPFSD